MADKDPDVATILLASGELDKAIVALEVACAMAAMGKTVNMWFILYGINVIKKPGGFFSRRKWRLSKNKSPGRSPDTDVVWQRLLNILNHDGANKIPLSQLNYFGLGPWILRIIMKKKGSPTLHKLIEDACELGVNFKICQPCVDVMALDIENDLLIKTEVLGVSTYVMEASVANYNAIF